MQVKGKLVSWNDEKGFGFIAPFPDGEQIFIHIKAFKTVNTRPAINQFVTYTVSKDVQGRPCATNAILAGDHFPVKPKRKNGSLSIVVAPTFLLVVGISVLMANVPFLVFMLYFVTSLFTFVVYARDKSAAKRGTQRTPENTLHLLSLAGGWPGALFAQETLRHKTIKKSFRSVFWVTVLLNCGAFIWVLTPTGSSTLQSFLASVLREVVRGD